MPPTDIDNLLFTRNNDKIKDSKDPYVDYCLEQYRIYLHVFNSTNERRQKSNEFFLGLNAAIIGILGYVETKSIPNANIIFMLVPFVGISIGYCWYRIINSYSQLNRAKFKVIHTIEQKLPITLFETEWHILGRGKNPKKYHPLSHTERFIPITFMLLYLAILLLNIL
ncbi:MAG: hypothetical protein NDI62_03520 [Burkholderiales bacterium]|nr:hypothetical protein [Burkholderiales bacterium]